MEATLRGVISDPILEIVRQILNGVVALAAHLLAAKYALCVGLDLLHAFHHRHRSNLR